MYSIGQRFGTTTVALLLLAAPAVAQQAAPRRPVAQAGGARQAAPQQGAQRAMQQAPARGTAQGARQQGAYPVRQTGGSEPLPQQQSAQQPGVAPGAGQLAAPALAPPPMPFVLTPAQQALLDQILLKWEQHSNRVKTFTCSFGRWEVNETFGPQEHHYVLNEAKGEIRYSAPDQGAYQVTEQKDFDKGANGYVARKQGLDHWVCDGMAIVEYNHETKQVIERQLAPEMRGKAITDGPLPFVFGTNAEQLKRRYWMKDITPADMVGKEIWLEAWPKYQRDAANFQHAIIVLTQRDFMPKALRIVQPDGKNKQDYSFDGISVNNPLVNLVNAFKAPRVPLGWSKVVIPAGGEQVAPPGDVPAQAQQPQGVPQRQ